MQNKRNKLRTVEGLNILQEPPKCEYGNYEMVVRSRYEHRVDKRWIEWRFTITDSRILKMIEGLTNLKNVFANDVFNDIWQTAKETHCRIMDMVMENRSFKEIKEIYDKAVKYINKNNYTVHLTIRNSPNSFTNVKFKLFPDFESVKAFIEAEAKHVEAFPNPEFFVCVDKVDFISGEEKFVCRTHWDSFKHKVIFEYERY